METRRALPLISELYSSRTARESASHVNRARRYCESLVGEVRGVKAMILSASRRSVGILFGAEIEGARYIQIQERRYIRTCGRLTLIVEESGSWSKKTIFR